MLFLSFSLRGHALERTWRYVQELSPRERVNLDLKAHAPRDPQISPFPTEQFPFASPYSAEEMGLRAMEFAHTPSWNCLLIDVGITITADGFLAQQIETSAVLALSPHGFLDQLYDIQPGQGLFRWISHSVNQQYPGDTTIVQVGHRTGKNFDVALETFFPRPGLPPFQG